MQIGVINMGLYMQIKLYPQSGYINLKENNIRALNEIIIHCTATRPSQDIGHKTLTEWARQKGWLDDPYHFVIRRNGEVEEGRPIEEIGAHCKGHNKNSIGVVLVGGVSEDDVTKSELNFTHEQWKTLNSFIPELAEKYNIKNIHGHNEYSKIKTCPNFDVQVWLKSKEIKPILTR